MKKIKIRQRFRVRLFFEGAAIGIATGAIISALRFLIDQADILRPIWFENLKTLSEIFLTAGILFLLAIFLSKVTKIEKQVGGSGIPQIKSVLQKKSVMQNPLRLLFLKFFAVTFGIGAGLSLGRAGVSVQFGACVGNFFGKIFSATSSQSKNFSHQQEEILLTAGAGAGLAAIFSAPLAGVIFCIEELHKKFTAEVLIATVTASVAATSTVDSIFGVRPIFETITAKPLSIPEILQNSNLEMFEMLSSTPVKFFLYFVLLGILLGIVGVIFSKSLLMSLDFYERLKISSTKKFLIPLLLIIPLGKFFPEILGCGNVLVDELLQGKFFLSAIVIFFVGKFFYTLICFGTNAPGGLFLPVLTLGALAGNIFACAGIELNLFSASWTTLFVVFGMVAMFAAVIKAPVTGSILIMELTGQFSYLLTLIIVSGVAFMTSDLLGGEPIFSALMNRKKIPPPAK